MVILKRELSLLGRAIMIAVVIQFAVILLALRQLFLALLTAFEDKILYLLSTADQK